MQTPENCIHQVFLIFLFLTVYSPGYALMHLVSDLYEHTTLHPTLKCSD